MNAISVYIPELKQGILSNKDGRLRIVTDKENYTLLLKHPEYKEIQHNISKDKIEIIIEKDSLFLDKPEIQSQGDSIIKKCTAHGPVYSEAVKEYKSYNYTSVHMVLKDVHSLIDKIGYKLDKVFLSGYKNKTLFHEL